MVPPASSPVSAHCCPSSVPTVRRAPPVEEEVQSPVLIAERPADRLARQAQRRGDAIRRNEIPLGAFGVAQAKRAVDAEREGGTGLGLYGAEAEAKGRGVDEATGNRALAQRQEPNILELDRAL